MGGIFLCQRSPGESLDAVEKKYKRSLQVFDKKGLKIDRRFARPTFVAYRYQKVFGEDENQHFLELQGGDFVLTSGTMIYNEKVGRPALIELFDDFCDGRDIDKKLLGNYCVVIFRNGHLWVLNDYYSYYPLYTDSSGAVISSSFLAVAHATSGSQINEHEFFEFLLHGFFVNERTLLSDVCSIDSRKIWKIQPDRQGASRDMSVPVFSKGDSLSHAVKVVDEGLSAYFETLGRAFRGRVGSAISGGYDSRLMLALIRKLNLDSYLYVYGTADYSDVVVAKAIADGEGLDLEHVDKSSFPDQSPDLFESETQYRLNFFDGLNPLGIIDDGGDIRTRVDRARNAPLQLNGGGGEMYREVWNLPDRRVDVEKFIRARFDRGAFSFCRQIFRPDDYFSGFAEKVKAKLGIKRSYLERNEAELMNPLLRNVFAASNNSSNNQLTYALLPYMERQFVLPCASIPIKYKYCGRFQAELIKSIHPGIARYGSSYGIDFSSPIPVSYRLKRALERQIPLSARLLKRRMDDRSKESWPYLLSEEYLERIVDLGNLQIAEFVDISKIRDAEIFTRALSIELILNATQH